MSGSTDPDLVQELSQGLIDDYMGVSVTALAVYEYVVTFDQEVKTGWQRRFNATSVLLVTTRWVMVLLQVLAWATSSTTVLIQILALISGIQTALFSALRIFALWGRNWILLTVILAIGLLPTVCTCLVMAHSQYEWLGAPYNVCNQYVAVPAREWQLHLDTVTVPQMWRARQLNLAASLVQCILRDGTIYFIIILSLNVTQLITYNLTPSEPLSTFGVIIPAILTSRFMMNLRSSSDVGGSHEPPGADTRTRVVSTAHFVVPSDLLGNIGEELDHSQSHLSEDIDLADGDAAGMSAGAANPELTMYAGDASIHEAPVVLYENEYA
ncbi:hypothetical protein PsYK624_014000 [Phanerochaete sordida]|uniref:DUF6533 domain-containing protein n=1 Tax=Phanerochaete sordida TaxID=48140 RepID=A0A9P3FZA5_9APHY|nr:hypothetical protein PsYK624_014000 [Phanerochaete sordida]